MPDMIYELKGGSRIDDAVIYVYELDHESPCYLFVRERGGIKRMVKGNTLLFHSLDAIQAEIQRRLAQQVADARARLAALEAFDTVLIHTIPPAAFGLSSPLLLK